MPTYKHWCYGVAKDMIFHYFGANTPPRTPQEKIAKSCIEETIDETAQKPDGKERLAVIDCIYVKKTHTPAGAAQKVFVSERTAAQWNSEFVYDVATKMGFL